MVLENMIVLFLCLVCSFFSFFSDEEWRENINSTFLEHFSSRGNTD